MNILIVGEFSAFAKHLKKGFEQLGHRVVVTLTGDKGLKATGEDVFYKVKVIKWRGKVIPGTSHIYAPQINRFIQRELDKRFPDGVDLIIAINYKFLSSFVFQTGVSLKYIQGLQEKGAKLIMSVCGGDPANHYAFADKYREWGYPEQKKIKDKRYSFLLNNSDIIIPTIYAYYYAIKEYLHYEKFNASKIHHAIPLPMTIDNDCKIDNCENRRIVIFHGINQPRMKGTCYIQSAMERIQTEFPDKVECICKGGLPYDEYVKLFDRIDILIDQASINGWGVNAAIGAMKGKCVLVSCGKENGENMGLDDVPFVEIKRDTENIYQVLKELILNPQKIDAIKYASRKFMENHCDCKIVAMKYLETVGLKINLHG